MRSTRKKYEVRATTGDRARGSNKTVASAYIGELPVEKKDKKRKSVDKKDSERLPCGRCK